MVLAQRTLAGDTQSAPRPVLPQRTTHRPSAVRPSLVARHRWMRSRRTRLRRAGDVRRNMRSTSAGRSRWTERLILRDNGGQLRTDLALFECCGVKFMNGGDLTSHMRAQHRMQGFSVELACCGIAFAEAEQLMDHVSEVHH